MTRMTQRMREGYAGTGPGAITPDGCAVELWARLRIGDEPEIIEAAAPAGARVLELGCGVGRMTRPLAERGFTVTAVDESPEMLERVVGAERTVCAAIEDLDLGERFDVVLLASFLVNAGDPEVRRGLLRTCRRHVADGGLVLVQREGDDWHDPENVPRESVRGDAVFRLVSSEPIGPDTYSNLFEYVFPDVRWAHTFVSRRLTEEQFAQALAEAGLAVERVLTPDRTWVRAVPVAEQ
jgi:SAM-dependent methyltransferase